MYAPYQYTESAEVAACRSVVTANRDPFCTGRSQNEQAKANGSCDNDTCSLIFETSNGSVSASAKQNLISRVPGNGVSSYA